jgi:glycine/D-amino acid oxidase-like deaminating enzyme/nitrite reductase/ring-hydroxylating ferredoxin subunit
MRLPTSIDIVSSMDKSRASLWLKTSQDPAFPPLSGDVEVDVCVVGGGIAGVTAARLLQRAGKRIALLDSGKIGNGVTGFTTAHLTEALDTRYFQLRKTFGDEGARLAAQSQRAAIDHIARTAEEEKLDCGFRFLPGYLYSETSPRQILQEHEAARACGLQVRLLESAPLPFATRKALRFERQAQFHPLRYLLPLARQVAARGGLVHEQTRALDVEDGGPCRVHTRQGLVKANDVLVCTHTPVNDRFFMHTKLAQYRSYVVTARPEKGIEGLFWDDADPYHYLRMHEGVLIAGGEDHKVGQKGDTNLPYARLRQYLRERFDAPVEDEWSAQVVEPVDGLPYIGRNSLEARVFVATGFSGNGMTGGTLAAMLLSDLVLGKENPWASLYQATRVKPLGLPEWVKENVDYPLHLIADRLKRAGAKGVDEVPKGEGRVVTVEGKKLAAYRDEQGTLKTLSAVCTHMACTVRWNPAERSWDCPCHGARFDVDGEVLNGPAIQPLAKK